MSTPIIAFFNNKGGVGKSFLAYHIAWMMARKGRMVLTADLDPQANLTANLLDEDVLETLWPSEPASRPTVYGSLRPLIRLVDVGPNLDAINRSAMLATDHVVIPLAPDLFSIQGLQNLGPTLRRWRCEWRDRRARNPEPDLELPEGTMAPAGYVLLGHGVRLGRPVHAYQRWADRIPAVYRDSVLAEDQPAPAVEDDPYCLARLKHYHSLAPLAYEARKPMFALKPADGAFGGHQAAVAAVAGDFAALVERILAEVNGHRQTHVAGEEGLDGTP